MKLPSSQDAASVLDEQSPQQPDREAQPVADEEAPRLAFPVVGIGASAGGLTAFTEFLSTLRADSGMAYVFIQHLPPTGESMLVEILAKRASIPVLEVTEGMNVAPNHLYVIRPGCTLNISNGALHLGERVTKAMHNRPVDDFFKSLAREQRERAICVVLSGMGSNGAAGAQAIKAVGGLCIAQEPETAEFPSMPRHLIDAGYADYVLPPKDIPEVLCTYSGHPYARGKMHPDETTIERNQQSLREVLAVLRTRTHQDFSGYKKPTVLRRIQRRMGLHHVTKLSDYAKILRQSTAEVSGLADDLLIHVTGFFRDPEAWEVFRQKIVVPLIGAREPESSIRCWVTACSSGEEAYTLAILLVEEAERLNKPLDIKVFATDMAERTLQTARNGVYPGGIESEIEPERLSRFFQREDAVYRVRPELRERVVFAPQNVLQDPPFSRLDVITSRNLLIYLEPEMQKRILALLHFGLREGGTLFLGSSETIAGAEDLFEPVDKKMRIFRRVGPTRHGAVDFPLPHAIPGHARGSHAAAEVRGSSLRPSMSQLSTRALLEHHTPASVTIDRDHRIVYYHGNTEPFIASPRGEPTRDLLQLVRTELRGAVRTAVHRAASDGSLVAESDGWIDIEPNRRMRVGVIVSTLDSKNAPDYLVVSFHDRGGETRADQAPAVSGTDRDTAEELRRIRDELQSTVEELQTSNEELKASHEEVVSTNEEIQSTNEELETSREEMQSLNEELSTVNNQLQAKIEEHQAAHNDLASLLTSTNIAVLFLDTRFRIRRFTPQVSELFEMLSSDIGRPLSDLAKKFTDAELLSDSQRVLTTLVPAEKEVAAENGRWFLRRVTPYRTADNRIDGVVVSFVDITTRIAAEEAVRSSEERFRLLVAGARDFAMIMMNEDGFITTWNEGAERLLGYRESEAVGAEVSLIFTPEDRAAGAPQAEIATASAQGRAEDERWHQRKDGSRFWGSGVMTAVRKTDGAVRGFVKVLRDETLRKSAENALKTSTEAAQNANRLKDEFLAVVSHELRTPLSAILLWARMLNDDPEVDPRQIQQAMHAITNSAESQKALIDDLLDVSRITSGQLRLQMRELPLLSIVKDAVESIVPTADAKGLTIRTEFVADRDTVRADPDRLRQVVWNLLTNAVKFTPASGTVTVKVVRILQELEIQVIDTGRGIDRAFLAHVFERFSQADTSSTRMHGGLGLGLAITKELVELHGGSIRAESQGTGKGTVFSVRLPLSKGTPDAVQEASELQARVIDAVSHDPGDFAGAKILLVEDDRGTRNAVSVLLRKSGGNVIEAGSAADALEAYHGFRPDVIISDIGLPGEDGNAFIRRVREAEAASASRRVPAVALTAFVRDADRLTAIDSGFQLHVAKPFDPDKLIQQVRTLLRTSKASS